MNFDYDPAKDVANIAKHGLSLADFEGFDDEPLVIVDDRLDYGEPRYQAFGRIAGRGHMIVYTVRDAAVRLISFRRAHDKEIKRHDQR
jgi:uncharacterized protein